MADGCVDVDWLACNFLRSAPLLVFLEWKGIYGYLDHSCMRCSGSCAAMLAYGVPGSDIWLFCWIGL